MDKSIAADKKSRFYWTVKNIREKIAESKVVVFAKGTVDHPLDGFSKKVFLEVERIGKPYVSVDVSEDRSIQPALSAFSGHRDLPLVYVNGHLVTSSDNMEEMLDGGELKSAVEEAFQK